ncbi:response regulator [Candidatus Scalindua japonica]|uniref:response regulator n=1 Tax=Candidatus Scalindua japonica TaxID=1284222 RepID=UPI0013A5AF62|nr:response regulator [Candidatus Scalindua japonica]
MESSICPSKLKELIDNTISKLNADCTSLLGRNFGISKPNIEISTLGNLIESNDRNYFLIKSELEESYHGNICTILQLKDAIKIGSILLGSNDAEIKVKLEKEDLDEDCTDGVTEFSGQFSGIIDSVFRNKLSKPVHIKLSSCTTINKDNASDILQDSLSDEYLHLSSLLLIKGFDTGQYNMFFPIESVDEFFGETIHEKTTNVLITDNSVADVRKIKKYLINTPFKVICSTNAKETFTILQKEKIHLILLELNLPLQNGIEICKSIKKTPYTRGIPLVMISGKPTQEAVIESLQAGARDFLVKPFNKEQLLKKINKFKVKEKPATLF